MNYFLKKKKWMAWVIMLTFLFTSFMPSNLLAGDNVAEASGTGCLTVTKIWDDNDNEAGDRPKSITFDLMRDGETEPINTYTLPDKDGNWSITIRNLPMYPVGGNPYEYYVKEQEVKNYKDSYSYCISGYYPIESSWSTEPSDAKYRLNVNPVIRIKNTYQAPPEEPSENVDITIWKEWKNDKFEDRPNQICFTLTATVGEEVVNTYVYRFEPARSESDDGVYVFWTDVAEKFDAAVGNKSSNVWSYTIKNLPQYTEDGDPITYTITESSVEGYKTDGNGATWSAETAEDSLDVEKDCNPNNNAKHTFTVTNTKGEPKYGEFSFKKVAAGTGEALQGAVFGLYKDNELVVDANGEGAVATSDANGKVGFKNLPLNTDEKTIFTLTETKAPDEYILSNTVYTVTFDKDGQLANISGGKDSNKAKYTAGQEYKIENQKKTVPLLTAGVNLVKMVEFKPNTETGVQVSEDIQQVFKDAMFKFDVDVAVITTSSGIDFDFKNFTDAAEAASSLYDTDAPSIKTFSVTDGAGNEIVKQDNNNNTFSFTVKVKNGQPATGFDIQVEQSTGSALIWMQIREDAEVATGSGLGFESDPEVSWASKYDFVMDKEQPEGKDGSSWFGEVTSGSAYGFTFTNMYTNKRSTTGGDGDTGNTGGGGDDYTPPETVINEPEVPLAEPELPEEIIEDPEVPLAEVPGEEVELEEVQVPLGDAPATGDSNNAIPFVVLMMVAGVGLAITRKKTVGRVQKIV